MVSPPLSSRVEEGNTASGLRIQSRSSCLFAKRARHADEGQIVAGCGASNRSRRDVIDMKGCFVPFLGETAILAMVTRPTHNVMAPPDGDGAHVRVAESRARAECAARSRSSVRNSASSTRPSASARSASLNAFPASCLSRSSRRRALSAAGSRNPARSSGISSSNATTRDIKPTSHQEYGSRA
jgi:hypothetical protein